MASRVDANGKVREEGGLEAHREGIWGSTAKRGRVSNAAAARTPARRNTLHRACTIVSKVRVSSPSHSWSRRGHRSERADSLAKAGEVCQSAAAAKESAANELHFGENRPKRNFKLINLNNQYTCAHRTNANIIGHISSIKYCNKKAYLVYISIFLFPSFLFFFPAL